MLYRWIGTSIFLVQDFPHFFDVQVATCWPFPPCCHGCVQWYILFVVVSANLFYGGRQPTLHGRPHEIVFNHGLLWCTKSSLLLQAVQLDWPYQHISTSSGLSRASCSRFGNYWGICLWRFFSVFLLTIEDWNTYFIGFLTVSAAAALLVLFLLQFVTFLLIQYPKYVRLRMRSDIAAWLTDSLTTSGFACKKLRRRFSIGRWIAGCPSLFSSIASSRQFDCLLPS